MVINTGGRALVRRSTRGPGVRSSHQPQAASRAAVAASRPVVVALPQPQSAPLEMARSRQTSAAERPSAPTRSKRPPERTEDSGTSASTRTSANAPRPAAVQNRTCQSNCSASRAAAGRPSAPPTPREALISAVAEPSRSAGSSSRMMLMPSGMTPEANPWRARPTIIGDRLSLSAHTTEPATRSARLISSIRRLPYMSPRRPMVGVATAAASRVAVIAQAVSAAGAPRRLGNCGTSGITTVCMSDTTMPEKASTATTVFAGGRSVGSAERTGAVDMAEPPSGRGERTDVKSVA